MKEINLKNLFKPKTSLAKFGPPVAWPVNFIRDWKIIVLSFALGLFILSFFAWQIYLSDKIAGGYLAPTAVVPNISIKTIDQKRLQADLLILETRQADWLQQKTSQPKLVDPSL